MPFNNVNVLSLFDGMACGRLALDRAGINVSSYYASEVDKYAIKVAQDNHPNIIQIGDVKNVYAKDAPCKIDLVLAGSPCQGFSYAGKQLNFEDERSALFFEFIRVLREVQAINPNVKFLLENVRMKEEWRNVISQYLGVQPILINSKLVSAQSRPRWYWSNIPGVCQPEDRGINFNDILQPLEDVGKNLHVKPKQFVRFNGAETLTEGACKVAYRDRCENTDTAVCIVARDYKGIGGREHRNAAIQNGILRRLSPIEYERLQTLSDNYTKAVSNTQRYKMCGNGWTVEVIAHILRYAKQYGGFNYG